MDIVAVSIGKLDLPHKGPRVSAQGLINLSVLASQHIEPIVHIVARER